MKILHIITGLNNGGAEGVLYRLITGDTQNNHIIISLMDEGVFGERFAIAGIRVHTIGIPRSSISIKGIIKLYRLIRSLKPDIIQTWMYHADLIGGIVAKLARAKIVIWGIRGPFNRQRTSLQTKIIIRLCAWLSGWIPRVILSNSEHAAKVHILAGYNSKKLITIPNGFLFNRFRPIENAKKEFLQELRLPEDTVLIGMVARFDPYKDHENLFNALCNISQKGKKIICLLIGPEMEFTNKSLCKLLDKYDIHKKVKLIGPREDVPKIMASLDLHVLSSAAESFPNVLAEAMACGTPCITTDVGDAALIVGNTGWIVPPSDPIALSNAIQEAICEMKDLNKWNERKEACRKHIIENYGLEIMIEAYNRLWRNTLHHELDEELL